MSIRTSGTGRGSIRTYPLPPDGFDPRAASPLELRRYGLPQRPDPAVRPELAARWDEVYSRKLSYITPTFLPVEELVPGLGRADRPRQDVTVTNDTWSGAVTHASPGETFEWVSGQWNVPYVEPGGQGGPGPWYASTWIGIDGITDVTQIGTMQIVSADLTTSCYAWYEWWSKFFTSPWQVIQNFTVSFGDTIYGLICMQSTTAADFSMINMTTGFHVGFGQYPLNAPGNTTSMENQAEWILERPEVGGVNPPLPDFSPVTFSSAYAGHGLDFVVDGGTADTLVNMVENGTTVATTTIESPTSIEIVYTGAQPPVVAGQLLAYADDGTAGNVSDPVAVGFGLSPDGTPGGWLDFKFLFAGTNTSGENLIYAVDQLGRLKSYADDGTAGNVIVPDPMAVGSVGWLDYKFLFAGTNASGQNRIYAVEQSPLGQLVSYADDGTDPVIVGSGGWLSFEFLFAGTKASGEPCIYAVNTNGRLLSYTDNGMAGNVDVLDPSPVGSEEWLDYKFLFAGTNTSGENGIYAVDPDGRLLFFTDDGLAGNASANVVGFDGWLAFKFLFAGENLLPASNRIYAVPT
jgi:Peptidase A4 family/Tachylectin